MGFETGDFPLAERMKALALHGVEYGFGSPKTIQATYVVKLLVLSVLAGTARVTWTSGVGLFWDMAAWWNQPWLPNGPIPLTVTWRVAGSAAGVSS